MPVNIKENTQKAEQMQKDHDETDAHIQDHGIF